MNNENNSQDLITTLKKAGLTENQSKAYLWLVENGSHTPAEIATGIGENRTNGYMITEKLEKLGLIEKKERKKLTYSPLHPSKIEILAEKRRRIVQKNETVVKQNINGLIDLFYAHSELPGTRTLHGIEGIKEVYLDALNTKKDVFLIRSTSDIELGKDFWHNYRNKLPKNNIHTYAITQDLPIARKNMSSKRDDEINFHRTLMPEGVYSAPVALQAYGDKLAIITFGKVAMATIINSPPIAESFKQIHAILTDHFQKNYPQK